MSDPEKSPSAADRPAPSRRNAAALVASGILTSRLTGFLRERAISHFLGLGAYADVLHSSLRAPNFLQNLLGEGTLSASFIPVYARLLEEGREEEAGRFAGAIFGLLLVTVSILVLVGMLLAEPLVSLLTPGYLQDAAQVAAGTLEVDRFPLAVKAVRIIFPMTGFLVLSVWALGVLNSHRRFLLPYLAPVLWNIAIISALLWVGLGMTQSPGAASRGETERLLFAVCFGALAGGVLQLGVQLPTVAKLLRGFRLSLSTRVVGVRDALRAFGPVVAARGAVQLGGYLDMALGTLLAAGTVGGLSKAQYIYLLPVSLFGLSVAAAELPELSRARGDGASAEVLRRVRSALRQTAFMTIPTAVGYLCLGLPIVLALFRTGSFGVEESWAVYAILAAYSLGLVASTASRLLQNAFYAMKETRTPARIAISRVFLSALLALPLMFWLDRISVAEAVAWIPGSSAEGFAGELSLGGVGLALAASVGAWLELTLLRRALGRHLPGFSLPLGGALRMLAVGVLAALPAGLIWWILPPLPTLLLAPILVGLFALIYLGTAYALGFSEASTWLAALRRRR